MSYAYKENGRSHTLYVRPRPGGGAVAEVSWHGMAPGNSLHAEIAPEDAATVAAGIAGALYEATGEPAPVILAGTDELAGIGGGRRISQVGYLTLRNNGRRPLGLESDGTERYLTAAEAWEAAKAFAHMAMAAEAIQPQSAEVIRLAKIIEREAPSAPDSPAIARAILEAGYTPPDGES